LTPQAVAWRQWDDDLILYNEATGSTHHLTSLGTYVMLALLQHPAGIDLGALVRTIDARVELAEGLVLQDEVERVLAGLAELRLVVRVAA